jgi:tol-pal system protein YbgF
VAAAAPADWRSALDQESANSQSSDDPGAGLYRKGLAAMKQGQYQNAVGQFGALMRRYPKSPLSEPAEYFSANALYESGKYDQSILQFNDLVIRSPNGRFASAALLREAQAFVKINDPIDARLTLQKILTSHPNSAEASAASSMMKDLQAD